LGGREERTADAPPAARPVPSRAERVLLAVADDADPSRRLGAYRTILLLHLAAELVLAVLRQPAAAAASVLPIALAGSAVVAFGLGSFPRTRGLAAPLAFATLLFAAVRFFPNVANHSFLLLVALGVLTLFDPHRPREGKLALGTLRWIGALVLFATGVQKVLHGTYFHGEFLAFQVAHGDRFAAVFSPLLPAGEVARLREIGAAGAALPGSDVFRAYETAPPAPGAGPYRLESPVGLALSNAVWIFELVAPAFLLWWRTRAVAVAAVVVFLLGIELGAREVMFGALFTATILMFVRSDLLVRLLPTWVLLYAALILSRVGVLPAWRFN
jgi:hypothetical protein